MMTPSSAKTFNVKILNYNRSIMSLINHQFRLAARPVGLPKRSDFNYTEEPVRDPGPGQILVKVLYVSLDPAMRGWMNEGKSYIAPVGIGDVMRAGAVGRVIATQNPGFAVGDHVVGMFGMQEYALSDGKGHHQGRSQPGAAAGVSGHARHAGPDGVLWPA